MMDSYVRSKRLIDPACCGLLVVDVQTKLLAAINEAQTVIHNADRLCRGAELLDVPRWATVQYTRGLGPLAEPLAAKFPNPEDKLEFSAAACSATMQQIAQRQISQIVLVGIETHICILQSAMDLLAAQFDVFVVADASASRKALQHQLAIQRMADEGAVIVATESVLFEWCQSAAHPHFKSISAIVREL